MNSGDLNGVAREREQDAGSPSPRRRQAVASDRWWRLVGTGWRAIRAADDLGRLAEWLIDQLFQ